MNDPKPKPRTSKKSAAKKTSATVASLDRARERRRTSGAPDPEVRPVRAAIYVRISMDREGAGLGVARQEEDCRELCARRGWDVVGVYDDNDTSAYAKKARKNWQRLLTDIKAGQVDAIVCWHVDRLTRSPRELEDVIDLHDRHGVYLATCTGEIDLSTPTGRMVARTLGAAARHESEHKAERQKRQQRQAAYAGKPHASGHRRPYGWAASGDPTIVQDEADVIREAARRVLSGEALASVCRSLDTRGIKSSTGRAWSALTLKALLLQARLGGRREYNPIEPGKQRPLIGEIVHAEAFPRIITPAESDQLRALLTNAARSKATRAGRTGGAAGRRYLLSGILKCSYPDCGAGLRGQNHEGGPRYRCAKEQGRPGCNRTTIRAHHADAEVRDRVLAAMDSPDLFDRLLRAANNKNATDPDEASKRLREIEEQREELAAEWATRTITRGEWQAARNVLDAEYDKLNRELSTTDHGRTLTEFAAMDGDVYQRWDQLSIGGQRALINACTHKITVHPLDPTKPRKRFDPDRINIEWRA